MELNAKKFGLALAEAAAIIYAVCAALVAAAPDIAWRLSGWLSHLTNLEVLGRDVTFGGVLIGLLQVIVYAYVSGWLFAVLYNRATKRR